MSMENVIESEMIRAVIDVNSNRNRPNLEGIERNQVCGTETNFEIIIRLMMKNKK